MTDATEVSRNLQTIAKELDARLLELTGHRVAFSLLAWTDQAASYISTADRPIVADQLRKLLAHWDAGAADVPAHQAN